MSGINPYIKKQEFELPKLNYKITFLPMKKNVEVLFENVRIPIENILLDIHLQLEKQSVDVNLAHRVYYLS